MLKHTIKRRGESDPGRTIIVRQSMRLLDKETNSVDSSVNNGRLLPFEKCGLESTWLICFPAAVKGKEEKKQEYSQKLVLEYLEDVEIDVWYTAVL